ncbi:HEAT repeat domain-containing protein [Paenibacillus methanolicus]|uniref:Phytanoyl-CoA dioxygenase PhyH n=1 Tax=Paenibacillus methanolicus TaxID=582686 RepID=A0A5S5CFQ9_9BACL|nr:HEAT repeat domain-containing protein [Paenibacillus methanolicus]TYP78127.1 phytanoyl-CoA dioxygenase PhyH [Paenibacillus methanolicus]
MSQAPILLNDEQMRTFIAEGFLILRTDFPEAFHRKLTEELDAIYKEEGNPGNNLLPRVREIQQVFDHPVITGALTSVLGRNYMLHAHRHGHYNAQPVAGGWHKDSYWGYSRIRNHHQWWAMIMYFPQDTPVALGPTGVMPGTQNYETRTFAADDTEDEQVASGGAGTFALIHYDIWHRSTPNVLGNPRYMLKFEFMRTEAPAAPTWASEERTWREPAGLRVPIARHEAMWEENWNWLHGQIGSLANTREADEARIEELERGLGDAFEPAALNAAYELARCGKPGVEALERALTGDDAAVSRLAAYGLSVAGEEAVPALRQALQDGREETVRHAAFALGELRGAAKEALPDLIALQAHSSAPVRCTAIEALGMIGAPEDAVVAALASALADADTQARFTAGLSLAQLGTGAGAAVPALAEALADDNRYVRAHASEALRYIGTVEAKDLLIAELFKSRWCASTTPASTFYP